jgi:tryptophan halogenase
MGGSAGDRLRGLDQLAAQQQRPGGPDARRHGPAYPYTRAIAHSAGWLWGIPLQGKIGNGFVYSSDFMSDDKAQTRLREMIDGEMVAEPRLIRFKAGRRHKAWHKNVVALGLAAGFIEPLESTSIHMIMVAIHRLLQLFPFGGCNDALSDRFNHLADDEIEKIRDFVVLHYKLTERTDSPFWDHCRTMPIPDSLAHRIALFRDNGHVFRARASCSRPTPGCR